MSRTLAFLLLCLWLPTVAAADMPTWQQNPTRNKPRKHVVVQFTDMSLHPSIAQVLEGGTVSWVNYATEYDGSIVFSNVMAKDFTCSDLRPNWMKTDKGYQSIPITIADTMNDLALPCPLEPGEYEYEIWLFTGPRADPRNLGDPQARLQGKIIVK